MDNLEDLHIVTVVTESKYYFPYLVESCKIHGKELTILGYGQKWKGFTWRFKLMLEYLEKLPETDIVCFIDGYDVLCLRDLSELKEEFIKIRNRTNCKIIVGHDKIDSSTLYYTFNYYWNYYYFGPCIQRGLGSEACKSPLIGGTTTYLDQNNTNVEQFTNDIFINAGTYIGYVYDLLHILKKLYNKNVNNFDDDQILLINYCKKNTEELYIDTNNKLFLTINKVYSEIDDLVKIKENKLVYNNNNPFFIHGPGKTSLTNILKILGYQTYKLEKKDNNQKIFIFIKTYFCIILLCIIFIIFNCYKTI